MKNLFTTGLIYKRVQGLILFVCFFVIGTNVSAQCTNDTNDPVFQNCSNKTVTLLPGECEARISPLLSATDNCIGKVENFSFNSSTTISDNHGCLLGNASYFQIFTPANTARYTPYTVNKVTVGIGAALNNPAVSVNVYKTNGTLNTAGWTLVGSGMSIVPSGSNTTADILVTAAAIMPTETFAIEVVTPTSAVFGNVAGMTTGQTNPTYVRSTACGIPMLTDVATVLGAGKGLRLSVQGTFADVHITPANASTPSPYSDFPIGVHNLEYTATDANGNSSSCAFTFTVNKTQNIVTSLACNDLVNISLDTACMATVQPDEILEGGPYGCYEGYKVVIYNTANQPIGDKLSAQHVGKTLKVSVIDSAFNSCWGLIKVEDKSPAPLDCKDIYTTCAGDLKPGSLLPGMITFQATKANGAVIPSNNKYARSFVVDAFGTNNATITDVDVMLDIEHTDASDLIVNITSPLGVTRQLVRGLPVCSGADDLQLKLDDEAGASVSTVLCEAVAPAISGVFRPLETLSVYDGLKIDGKWIISVIDSSSTDGGTINELSIVFKQTGAKLPFPTSKPVTFTELGNGYLSVIGIDPCGPVNMSYTDKEVAAGCDTIYAKIIDRTWSAIDQWGNTSPTCVQRIHVYRNGLATLQWPPNYDGISNPTLSCMLYGDNVPSPDVTGRPNGDFCDNVQIFPHEDLRIDICDKSYKILRKWRILEWCSGEVYEHTQLIKVLDDQGPELTKPADITLSTDPLDCSRDYTVPRPVVKDGECSNTLKYILSYYSLELGQTSLPVDAQFVSTGIVNDKISDLPIGMTFIRWRVEDECGNASETTFKVTIVDQVPPVAVCDQFTKVSIGSYKYSRVAAISFDDLSNDNCEIVKWEARKMTNKCPQVTNNSVFRDSVIFCCEEVGTKIMVEFRVTDRSNNSNTCMVEVEIEDKLPPHITECPADITLDCQADFKNTTVTGLPKFIDNCDVVSVNFTDSGSPDQCGEGTIRRTWTVKDAQNLSATCVQIIKLEDKDPFDKNDIVFSPDYNATTCNQDLSPENLPAGFGYPRITDDDCNLTSVTFKDQVFTFVDGACEKILRTWTVIDWCTYVQGTSVGIYTDLQVIKLSNAKKPEFIECKDVTANVDGDCRGEVTGSILAKDDCTKEEELKYTYKIDLNGDGLFTSAEVNLAGSGKTYKHILPIGKHKVIWTVEDKCGNKEVCNQNLTVRDGKKPTPYCLSSVTTVVMPSTGTIAIWAKDFDHGSFDNCTPKNKLKISFSSSTIDTGKIFRCTDIPDGIEVELPLEIWITDEAGNQDYCTVNVVIQDNSGDVCKDDIGSKAVLGGRVKTDGNKSLAGAMVSLYEGTKLVKQLKTNSTGNFLLENIPTDKNYELGVEKNDDILNGLSTLDLVLIQRHILGVTKHDSPFKVIASDANNDGKVTAADLVILRKLILGMTLNFTNNQKSWRFVNSTKPYDNPTTPFPFHERISLNDLAGNMYNQDFGAIKIGDVNNSTSTNVNQEVAEPRSNEKLRFGYEISKLGSKTSIKVYAQEDAKIYGFQSKFDLANASIKKGKLNVNDENYVSNERATAISWNDDKGIEVKKDELLFTIEANDAASFELNNKFANEAYLSTTEVSEIELFNRSQLNEEMAFEVYQNEPNPFANQTNIGFRIPEAADVTLKVYDQSGKILYKQTKNFGRGVNFFVVSQQELESTGIMYYEINSNQFKATRKMVGLR